jgi:hypothetical protein
VRARRKPGAKRRTPVRRMAATVPAAPGGAARRNRARRPLFRPRRGQGLPEARRVARRARGRRERRAAGRGGPMNGEKKRAPRDPLESTGDCARRRRAMNRSNLVSQACWPRNRMMRVIA